MDTKHQGEYADRIVKFSAIYGREGENADYSKATPWGELNIKIDQSTPAYDAFVPGKDYYLTFEEAPTV